MGLKELENIFSNWQIQQDCRVKEKMDSSVKHRNIQAEEMRFIVSDKKNNMTPKGSQRLHFEIYRGQKMRKYATPSRTSPTAARRNNS